MISFILPYKYLESREGRIEKCLAAIKAQRGLIEQDEVIVADLSKEKHNFEGVRTIHQYKSQWSRAFACNLGISVARNRYIAIVDIDVILPVEFRPRIAATPIRNAYMVFDTYEGGKCRQPGFEGYCIVFDKELWRRIGGFDEDFVGYGGEDIDFKARLDEVRAFRVHHRIKLVHLPHPRIEKTEEGDLYGQKVCKAGNEKKYLEKKEARNARRIN